MNKQSQRFLAIIGSDDSMDTWLALAAEMNATHEQTLHNHEFTFQDGSKIIRDPWKIHWIDNGGYVHHDDRNPTY